MNVTKQQPQADAACLQPLKEVGSLEKTQFWCDEEIEAALRSANLRGIAVDRLRMQPGDRTLVMKAP